MAFMMPVVKKNYSLYGAPQQRQRRTSSETSTDSGGKSTGKVKRKTKSETTSLSTSLSTSPAAVIPVPLPRPSAAIPIQTPKEMLLMRRVRGSAPTLAPSTSNFVKPVKTGNNTAPTGNSPIHLISSPSHSSHSSSSSSCESNRSIRFHQKLVAKLRRSFRFKDPAPSAT